MWTIGERCRKERSIASSTMRGKVGALFAFVSVALTSSVTHAQQPADELAFFEQLRNALGTIHGVNMSELRAIPQREQVRAILLEILDPEKGESWGPGWPKLEFYNRAIVALGQLSERRAIPRLKAILGSTRGSVRTAAAQALGRIDVEDAKDLLYGTLITLGPDDLAMQSALVTALSQSRDRQMYAKLEQYIRGERNIAIRRNFEKQLEAMRKQLESKR